MVLTKLSVLRIAALIPLALCTSFHATTLEVSAQQSQADHRQIAMVLPILDISALKQSAYLDYNNLQFESALQKYQQIARSATATAADRYWLGETYFHLGQFDRAAESFEQASPMHEEARVRLVETYLAARRIEKANSACTSELNMTGSAQTVARLRTLQKVLARRSPPAPQRSSGPVEK